MQRRRRDGASRPEEPVCHPGAVDDSRLTPLDAFDFGCAIGVTDVAGDLLLQGEDVERALMSVSKPVTALGALVAVRRGLLDLDEPAGPEGATVRHLLAHTAGYGFDTPREKLLAGPGERRIYSNTGFEVLGEHVAEATGYDLPDWLEETVVTPLGLRSLDVQGSPASGYRGTVSDLLVLAREHLAPTLVPGELAREARSVQFPGLAGILPGYGRQAHNDWGLGVELRDHKDPHWTASNSAPETFGHFGQSGSFWWVDPTRGIAAAFLGDEPFGPVHVQGWPPLTAEILRRADAR